MSRNTVLVVEDEPRARLAVIDACERAGFEVADFGRTDDALTFAASTPESIVAIVTDIDVPGDHDGIDLAARAATAWPHIRVIVTSGRYGSETPPNLPSGVRFVAKPWTAKVLIEQVRG